MPKQKLELTWIGKDERLKLEPRILIEDPSKSYGDPKSENMLIHGDNLLALKALEQEFSEKMKVVYIDPPFNTGAAFEHYDDSVEHSIWLNLMKERVGVIHKLIRKDGSIFIHLDDNEIDYFKIVMDEIFGRNNFISRITIDVRSPSAFSTVNPGVFKASEYLLWYAKDKEQFTENTMRIKRSPDYAYNKWLDNPDVSPSKWTFRSVVDVYETMPKPRTNRPDKLLDHFNAFIVKNAKHLWRPTEISDTGAGRATVDIKNRSLKEPNKVFVVEREKHDPIYILNGQQMSFYSKNVHLIDGEVSATTLLTNIWTDIAWEGIAAEGGVQFKKGKKPERLLKRCIELCSIENDYVLDSFLGSGTTASVAHKMKRNWIGVELGDHANTHCLPRLKMVIDGKDKTGISELVGWGGGGGFKFYNLVPSLLQKDKFGNWIIDEKYNANKLAAAMCKHEGFKFSPNADIYWKQGQSTETDFIFVTTVFLTVKQLDKIHEEMKEKESLLICAKSFASECEGRYSNITIRKIPQMILGKCEFGKDNYNLNIIDLPREEDESTEGRSPEDNDHKKPTTKKIKQKLKSVKERKLF